MKKIEYQAPKMEVIELKSQKPLLSFSNGENNPDNPVWD